MKFVSGVLLPTGKPTKRRTTIRLATGASKTQRRATRRRTTLSQMWINDLKFTLLGNICHYYYLKQKSNISWERDIKKGMLG